MKTRSTLFPTREHGKALDGILQDHCCVLGPSRAFGASQHTLVVLTKPAHLLALLIIRPFVFNMVALDSPDRWHDGLSTRSTLSGTKGTSAPPRRTIKLDARSLQKDVEPRPR